MNRKTLMASGIVLLLMATLITFFAVIKPNSLSTTSSDNVVQNTTLKIAAVNEDTGTIYNGQVLNMGTVLLHSFDLNTNYEVEVVSRAIAERGLENDAYQLMIVLPSKFSEEALALEQSAPKQANFQYQITSDEQLTVKQAEQAVVDFKSLFNKDLINIYFASIIGNLQTAQAQVNEVVSNEGKALNSYNTLLVDPLVRYSKQFTGLATSPTDLLSTYSAFNKDLSNSNDAFTSIINVDKSYETELEQIKSFQEAWQTSILTREENLHAFEEQISKLNVDENLTSLNQINDHIATNLNEPAVWKETSDRVNAYNEDITTLLTQLKELNTSIDTTLSNYDSKISEAVESSLADNSSALSSANQTLGSYITALNKSMSEQIIAKWPSRMYSDESLDGLSLSNSDKQHLKNVNSFMVWYANKEKLPLPASVSATYESEALNHIRNQIVSQVEQRRDLALPTLEGTLKTVDIHVPSGFQLFVEGFNPVKVSDTHYQLSFSSTNDIPAKFFYSLAVTDQSKLSILTPAVVSFSFTTEEEVEVVKPGEPKEISRETQVESTPVPATETTSATTTSETEATETEVTETETTETAAPTTASNTTKTVTITVANETEKKMVQRRYEVTDSISNWSYDPTSMSSEIYKDVQEYLQLSGVVTAYYGLNLSQGSYLSTTFTPLEGSLASLANSDDLKSIVTNLIKTTTVEAFRDDLKISDEELNEIESRLAEVDSLLASIEGLRTSTTDLISQTGSLIEETSIIQKTLQDKPAFTDTEKRENTDIVTVSMDMNSDLTELMAASQSLMEKTKSNQAVAETIESNMQQLSTDVTTLETDGESLNTRVNELQEIMAGQYGTNEEFLQQFSTVLSNTKTGNQKNQAVYDYLSNPVDASKIENVLTVASSSTSGETRQDDRTSLMLILIGYLISLAIAYLLQHSDIQGLQERFKLTQRLSWKNATGPVLFLSISSFLSGAILALVTGYKLDFSIGQTSLFIFLMALIVINMTYGVNLLLAKLKSFGFLIGVALLMLYLSTATQLFDTYYVYSTKFLASFSPLNYLELMIRNYINQQGELSLSVSLLVALALGLTGVTVLLYRTVSRES
ncbi:type VII secretion protein EsaA [Streptococcus suis]